MNWKSKSAFAGVMLLASMGPAQAATLTGDTVTVDIDSGLGVKSGLVGDGTDIQFGNALFDFNAGPNGNEFQLTANGSFPEFTSPAGPLTILLSSLDFSGGEVLIGFTNLFSVFQNTSFSFTRNSLTFTMDDGPNGPDVILSGVFQTAVPLPAALPLFGTGLAALGVIGWRRKRKTIA